MSACPFCGSTEIRDESGRSYCFSCLTELLPRAMSDEPATQYQDYTDDPEYHKFVESLAPLCTCTPESLRPCEGLLAGGLCDDLHLDGDEFPGLDDDDDV